MSRAGRRSRGEPGFPELPGMVNDGPSRIFASLPWTLEVLEFSRFNSCNLRERLTFHV